MPVLSGKPRKLLQKLQRQNFLRILSQIGFFNTAVIWWYIVLLLTIHYRIFEDGYCDEFAICRLVTVGISACINVVRILLDWIFRIFFILGSFLILVVYFLVHAFMK